jgi:hypothetical protein
VIRGPGAGIDAEVHLRTTTAPSDAVLITRSDAQRPALENVAIGQTLPINNRLIKLDAPDNYAVVALPIGDNAGPAEELGGTVAPDFDVRSSSHFFASRLASFTSHRRGPGAGTAAAKSSHPSVELAAMTQRAREGQFPRGERK